MATGHCISSPHGISKRFRLSSYLPSNTFKEIDEILHPVVKEELQKIELNKDCSYTNGILLKKDKIKDWHNDSCSFTVMDAFTEHSALPLGKIYNETKETDILTFQETEHNIVVKQTCNLENNIPTTVLNKSSEICFNTVDHQSRQEFTKTSLELHHQKFSKKDETELSANSFKSLPSNVLFETTNDLKESTKFEQISAQKSTHQHSYKSKQTNGVLRNNELKSIPPEECNRNLKTFEDSFGAELHNNGGICLEDKNNFILQSNENDPASLEIHKLEHFFKGLVKGCNNSEITVNNLELLEESKLVGVKIAEGSKPENISLGKYKPRSKLHSLDYEMFSKVIQKARNKVKPRTRPCQPSIIVKNEKLRKNLYTFEKLDEYSKIVKESDSKSKLTRILHDMGEMEDFLSFCGEDLMQMASHISTISGLLQFLSSAAETIEIVIEKAEIYEGMFANPNMKNTDKCFQIAIGIYAEIHKLGDCLLTNIIKQGKTWRQSLDKYKASFDTVVVTTRKFCSISIEDKLIDSPNLVYAVFEELKTQVLRAQKIQNKFQDLYNTESIEIWNINEGITKLKDMSNELTYLVGKCT